MGVGYVRGKAPKWCDSYTREAIFSQPNSYNQEEFYLMARLADMAFLQHEKPRATVTTPPFATVQQRHG